MFTLFFIKELGHKQRFTHEDLAIHVFECFESIIGSLLTDEPLAPVYLILLITFTHSVHLDFN